MPQSGKPHKKSVMQPVRDWLDRHFSDPQIVILTLLLTGITLAVVLFGDMLAPVIASIVIAYLFQGLATRLEHLGVPEIISVWVVFLTFMALLLLIVFGLLPVLIQQLSQLIQQMPSMMAAIQKQLLHLPQEYPQFVSPEQITKFTDTLRAEIVAVGQRLLSYGVSSLVAIIAIFVYLILVPFLVFFFIKDRERIVGWLTGFLPRDRELTARVWADVNAQITNYIRGKFLEILIVGVTTFVVFSLIDLDYALLLSAITGLSVLIPYIGAATVTVPVALVAFFQWGIDVQFLYAVIAYGIIQALDGNILAPLLLGDAVNLHPVAIIVAVLLFGGLWGFWGVFFAIPLATVVQAVLRAWPRIPAPEADDKADAA